MERKSAKRKSLRSKYKRYAAAVLGTAIMTGAALPGIPAVSKALAAEQPASPPMEQQQLKRHGWHEHKYDWPGSNENKGWYENGRIYYRSSEHAHGKYADYFSIPVQVVKDYAERLGFSVDRDSFTILHQSRHRATVQVINNDTGQRFKVTLERDDGDWQIIAVRGIGDSHFPATFRSIGRF